MSLDLCPQLRHSQINCLLFNRNSISHQRTHPQSRKIVHTSAKAAYWCHLTDWHWCHVHKWHQCQFGKGVVPVPFKTWHRCQNLKMFGTGAIWKIGTRHHCSTQLFGTTVPKKFPTPVGKSDALKVDEFQIAVSIIVTVLFALLTTLEKAW